MEVDLLTPLDVVDHVDEVEDGGAFLDPENLQSLCNACHKYKTDVAKKKREKKNSGSFGSISDF